MGITFCSRLVLVRHGVLLSHPLPGSAGCAAAPFHLIISDSYCTSVHAAGILAGQTRQPGRHEECRHRAPSPGREQPAPVPPPSPGGGDGWGAHPGKIEHLRGIPGSFCILILSSCSGPLAGTLTQHSTGALPNPIPPCMSLPNGRNLHTAGQGRRTGRPATPRGGKGKRGGAPGGAAPIERNHPWTGSGWSGCRGCTFAPNRMP